MIKNKKKEILIFRWSSLPVCSFENFQIEVFISSYGWSLPHLGILDNGCCCASRHNSIRITSFCPDYFFFHSYNRDAFNFFTGVHTCMSCTAEIDGADSGNAREVSRALGAGQVGDTMRMGRWWLVEGRGIRCSKTQLRSPALNLIKVFVIHPLTSLLKNLSRA